MTRRRRPVIKAKLEERPMLEAIEEPIVREQLPRAVYELAEFRQPEKINAICIGGPSDGRFAKVDPTAEWPLVEGVRYERTFIKLHLKHFFALVYFNPTDPITADDMMQMLLCGYGGSVKGRPTVSYSSDARPSGRKFDFSV